MDSNAINFAMHATINTKSWCIMPVDGCMMPPVHATGASFDGGSRSHTKDGTAKAGSFDPLATRNVNSMCTVERYGCMDVTAANYDNLANTAIPGYCILSTPGCLNLEALNYGCTALGPTPCDDVDTITLHDRYLCQYEKYSPPAAPPPPMYPNQEKVIRYTATGSMTFEGSAQDCVGSKAKELITTAVTTLTPTADPDVDATCTSDPAQNQFTINYVLEFKTKNNRDAFVAALETSRDVTVQFQMTAPTTEPGTGRRLSENADMKAAFATVLGVPASDVTIVTTGSITLVTVLLPAANYATPELLAAAAQDVQTEVLSVTFATTVNAAVGDGSSLSLVAGSVTTASTAVTLSAAVGLTVVGVSTPVIGEVALILPVPAPPPPPPVLSVGAIVGIAIGAVIGVIVIAAVAFYCIKKRGTKTSPNY